MNPNSRYVVGIDLGTSNTAMACVDTTLSLAPGELPAVATTPIVQVVAPGAAEARPLLPSALYVRGPSELPAGALNLPWMADPGFAVGAFAREQGAKVPTRHIHSSKSWLCHGGVDREAPILPPGTPEEDAKRSPAEVARLVLEHLRQSWNHTMAKGDAALDLANQQVVLCVPASFDAGARNLTQQAAERAGLKHVVLLEEPQAAFYAWVESTRGAWRKQVKMGDLVLVVDVGGGTSDFSLIAVTEAAGELELRRIAVGEHILLGGDNMDLALAYGVSAQIEKEKGKKLDPHQFAALVQQCRMGKEALLSNPKETSFPIAILGRGSSVIGGTIKAELRRDNLETMLVDGFFPRCAMADRPTQSRRAGFRSAGLPYAEDPAITLHLAKFLGGQHGILNELFPGRPDDAPALPTAIFFNGGVFRAEPLRQRVLDVVSSWCTAAGAPVPRVLLNEDLDLAVARGAAYLGLARRGTGVRIRGGSARSYYIGIEGAAPAVPGMPAPFKAMCVVPYGLEEGSQLEIPGAPAELCVWTGEPAEFRFLSSRTRRTDQPGTLHDVNDSEFEEHSPIETTLGSAAGGEGKPVEVDLRSHLTEIGTLELHCVERDSGKSWRLEFNVGAQGEG